MTRRNVNALKTAVKRFFEGDDNGGQQTVTQDPPAPAPAPTPAPTLPIEKTKAFNDLLNAKLAEERRKSEDKNRQLVGELNTLKESKNLTVQQQEALQSKIEELESTYRTAEEQKKIELAKQEEKYNKDLGLKTKEADLWKSRHDSLATVVEINRASQKYEAWDPEQIEAILRPLTKVVDQLDSKGNPTGNLTPKVKFPGRNKEGEPMILDISVDEAVKQMHEWPEKYGNLFKNTAANGLGANPNGGASPRITIDSVDGMNIEQYKKNRQKIHAEMQKKG